MDINRRGYQRNRKFLRATSEIPNTTFENMTEETLETMKYDIENKAVTQSSSKGTHSLIKDVQQEQKGADTKNSKLESKSPSMKTKSEVLKERAIERDDHMRNENGVLRTKTRVIKKPIQRLPNINQAKRFETEEGDVGTHLDSKVHEILNYIITAMQSVITTT